MPVKKVTNCTVRENSSRQTAHRTMTAAADKTATPTVFFRL